MAAIIASVAPQVTVISRSGSISPQPGNCRGVVSAMASRSGLEPQVIAYWLRSASTASAMACLSSGGQAKSGKPWARLTAPCATARRFMSRMTDSVKRSALAEILDARIAGRIGSDQAARDGFVPRALEEPDSIDVDLEVDGQVEVGRRARLAGVGPDLDAGQLPVAIGLPLLPSIDHVSVELRPCRIVVPSRHPQGLGRVDAPAVRDDGLTAVVDVDGHGPGDHVLIDAPDRGIRARRAGAVQ